MITDLAHWCSEIVSDKDTNDNRRVVSSSRESFI